MSTADKRADWFANRSAAFVLWYVPIAAGIAGGFLLPMRGAAIVWAAAFAWMGAACIANALRCHRLHCYISGPVFLLGALASVLIASGVVAPGARALSNTVSATLVLVLLAFLPELIWRKYA